MSHRGSRFLRDNRRCGLPNDMARHMATFGIPNPTQRLPDPPQQAIPAPLSEGKRGLIRIVTDKDPEEKQFCLMKVPPSSDKVPSGSVEEGASRVTTPVERNGSPMETRCGYCGCKVFFGGNVNVPTAPVSTTYVPPVNPTPVASLKDLLAPIMAPDFPAIESMTVIANLVDGEKIILHGAR